MLLKKYILLLLLVSDLGGTLKMTRRSPALDEITNKVFEELLKGKSEEPSFIDFECASNKVIDSPSLRKLF